MQYSIFKPHWHTLIAQESVGEHNMIYNHSHNAQVFIFFYLGDIIMEAMQFLQTFEVFQNGYCPSSSFWEKIVQELNNSGIVQALFNYNSKSFGVFTKKIMIIRVQRIASSHLERPISV